MGFKLSIALGIALVMLSGAFKLYYDKSEAEKMAMATQLQTAMDNQLRLENAVQTQNEQIEKAVENKKTRSQYVVFAQAGIDRESCQSWYGSRFQRA